MLGTATVTAVRNPDRPRAEATDDWQESARPRTYQAADHAYRRRFDGVAVGFWLGGLVLGTAGCILGACMPYRHPVAVTISVVWWGIYLGCSGAGFGALFGMWIDRTPAPPSRSANESTCAGSYGRWPTCHRTS
jgi:hypothetical protein